MNIPFLLIGSGYSIISEIEHQLGLRGNKSTTIPGQDTINEEEEKRKFFEDLEKGHGSSLDYSELNRRLDDNASLSHSLRYVIFTYYTELDSSCTLNFKSFAMLRILY